MPATKSPTAWHFNLLAGPRAVGRQPHTGSRRYYHADLLGSVRAVVTGATVVEATDYDPWGVVLAGRSLGTPGSGTREGFTSQPRDLTVGWDDFGARQYLAAYGRWGGVDPRAGAYPEWSGYNYVLGDPLTAVDPDGQWVVLAIRAAQVLWRVGAAAYRAYDAASSAATLVDPNASASAKALALADAVVPGNASRAAKRGAEVAQGGAKGADEAAAGARAVTNAADETAGQTAKLGGDAAQGGAGAAASIGRSRSAAQFRGPDPRAEGPHTRFRTDEGGVSHYETYGYPSANAGKRVDVVGPAHGGVSTPHTVETTKHVNPKDPSKARYSESRPRQSTPEEIPKRKP